MNKRYKRKNYFIKKAFQGRFVFQFYLLVILGAVIFSVIFSYATFDTLTVTYDNYNLQLDRTPFLLFKQILTTNWIIFLPVGLLVVIVAIFQTHRIAGPLYKIEMVLDEMSQGVIDRNLHLRPKDEAQEIITKLNTFNGFLAEKILTLQRLSSAIDRNIDKSIQDSGRKGEPISDDLPQIQADIKKLKDVLAEFRIKE